MGFCVFSNIGIAIRHAQQVRGVGRIAVVDWDVHHGNGTETIFLSDPNMLAISLHQDEHYPPGRGRIDVVGEGAGRGTNLNIPLPPGGGISAYGLRLRARRRAGAARVPAGADHRRERVRRERLRPARAHGPERRRLPRADGGAHGGGRRRLRGAPDDEPRGRLLVVLRPVLRPGRDRADERHRSDTDFSGVAPDSHRSRPARSSRRTSAPPSSALRRTWSWFRRPERPRSRAPRGPSDSRESEDLDTPTLRNLSRGQEQGNRATEARVTPGAGMSKWHTPRVSLGSRVRPPGALHRSGGVAGS